MGCHVVVTRAPQQDYRNDYVSLPPSYGSKDWQQRPDVAAITRTVHENLERLDRLSGFTRQLQGRRVIIKPNLVTVFHNAGFVERDYPNTTDPRVLDAVIEFFQRYSDDIIIAESSGRSMPTRGSFRIAGLHRLARRRGVKLVALEEQPVDLYMVPSARIMKTMLLPRLFRQVVSGEAFYVSLPKLKTNLFTTVTLGSKNSMGCIPYNLRQKNHNYDLEQKLVDMLYLFKPHLTIIDGIVGAQGQCPAPVEPVDSRVIISGNNSVETDWVATGIMGFDPASVKLNVLARQQGFGHEQCHVEGDTEPAAFRPADPSLLGNGFARLFPNVRVLIGHSRSASPNPGSSSRWLEMMENSCRGGCLATTRLGFEFIHHEGLDRNFHLTLVIGAGWQGDGQPRWYDRDGKAWNVGDIDALDHSKIFVGNCAVEQLPETPGAIPGCMVFPNAVHMKLHTITGSRCRLVNPLAPSAPMLLWSTWRMRRIRMGLLRRGEHLDYYPGITPETGANLPPLTRQQRRRLIRDEWREIKDLIFY